jgi:OmpA-OmpF porin, OOP family
LTPVEARITDQAIRGDMGFIRSHQARLKALNDSGDNPNTSYHYAKALHWVDFALDEYEMKNRSGVIEQALDEGNKLIAGLEAKRSDMPMQTPILPLSSKVRDDLWAAAERMKADKDGFKCAGGDIARMEVQLVWAGHIQRDLGWRSAKPHLQAAERYYRDAVAGAETCPRPVPVATPAAEKRATDDAALAKLPPAKQIEILADRVHFAYDRANISVATAPILDRVASLLRANTAISVTVEGHADERGSEAYNVKLSQRRADAVRAYLVAAGVEAARLKTQAFGKAKPEVKASGSPGDIEGHALNRRVVFVPSVATDLKVNPQREDLQTKGDPAGKSQSGRPLRSKRE